MPTRSIWLHRPAREARRVVLAVPIIADHVLSLLLQVLLLLFRLFVFSGIALIHTANDQKSLQRRDHKAINLLVPICCEYQAW